MKYDLKVFRALEVDLTYSRTMLVPASLAFSQVMIAPENSTDPKEVQAFTIGSWDHPIYGEVDINADVISRMSDNFGKNVYGQDLSINFEHGMDAAKGLQAAGWVRGVIPNAGGLNFSVEFTKDAMQEIKDGKWRYFSPEFYSEWTNPSNKYVYHDVLVGGALTNAPFFKGMQPLNFSDLFTANDKEKIVIPPIKRKEGDPQMDRTKLLAFAERLGIKDVKDEVTDEALEAMVFAEIKKTQDELEPLRQLSKELEGAKTFRESYPAEFKRMNDLETTNRVQAAKSFSMRFARFTKKDGESVKVDTKGFSARAIELTEKLHMSFSEGNATVEDFSELMELVRTGEAVVDFSEDGSSIDPITNEIVPGNGGGNSVTQAASARQAFSNFVKEIQKEEENKDKPLTELVRIAAERNPQLFSEYQSPLVAAK